MFKKTLKTAALVLFLSAFSLPALAEDPTCSSSDVCSKLDDKNWTYEFDHSVTTIDTDVVFGEVFNQAELKSGGRASDNNRSNFQEVTTTVSETTSNYFNAINKGGNHVSDHDGIDQFSTIISSETVKVKVK